jgi:hypothetical protein
MASRVKPLLALALAAGLTLSACGTDDADTAGDTNDESGQSADTGGFAVSITADGITVPDEVVGGVVEVRLESEEEGASPSFTRVTAGTSEDDFRNAIVKVVSGQPFPEFIEANTGIEAESSTILLPEGEYFAWTIPDGPEEEEPAEGEGEGEQTPPAAEGGEGEGGGGEGEGPGGPPPEAVLLKGFKVTAGEPGDLPQLEDSITIKDYSFDVNIKGGADEVLVKNDGPGQYHHAEVFNFGDLDPAKVEAELPKFLQSGPEAEPPALFKDINFDEAEAGSSAVFSPGLGGTSKIKIESGNTYGLVCFISDKTGGPPHAFAYNMFKVFKAE